MNKKITMQQKFNRPIDQVFELFAKHATYNKMFWPVQVVRVKDAADPQRPDGVGSVRKLGFGRIKPLQEQITRLQENQFIEYKIIDNPLVKHHLGYITFKALTEHTTLVTYSIEFDAKLPFVSTLVLSQLKLAISTGMAKFAKSLK